MDILKEIGDLLSKFPELAIWILVGLLFYKVFVIGSWVTLIRLAIVKAHDLAANWRHRPKQFYIGDILCKVDENRIKKILLKLRKPDLNFIHDSDIDELEAAINKHLEKGND